MTRRAFLAALGITMVTSTFASLDEPVEKAEMDDYTRLLRVGDVVTFAGIYARHPDTHEKTDRLQDFVVAKIRPFGFGVEFQPQPPVPIRPFLKPGVSVEKAHHAAKEAAAKATK